MAPRSSTTGAAVPPVSMAMLAHRLGLSVATVSRALSDHARISARTKQQVLAMAEALNYQPNQLAASLRKGQSRLLGVVVPAIGISPRAAMLQGIEQAARQAGFSSIVCQSHDDERLERAHLDTLLNAQVAGILVSLAGATQYFGHFAKVAGRGVPLVFFERAPAHQPLCSALAEGELADFGNGSRATLPVPPLPTADRRSEARGRGAVRRFLELAAAASSRRPGRPCCCRQPPGALVS